MAEKLSHHTPFEKEKPNYIDWGKAPSHTFERETLNFLGGFLGIDDPYKTRYVTDPTNNNTYELLSVNAKLNDPFLVLNHTDEYRILSSEVRIAHNFTDEHKDTLERIVHEYVSSFVVNKK